MKRNKSVKEILHEKLHDDLHANESASEWRKAIEFATVKIKEHRKSIRSLERSVRIMEEQIKAGEPWPAERLFSGQNQ